jgi:hypothetical protein
MVVDLTGQFLYVSNSNEDGIEPNGVISVYRIGGNGSLMEIKGSLFYSGPVGDMAVSP